MARGVGLLDTSVVIDLGVIAKGSLPEEIAVSAITFAELSAGPHAAKTAAERARRQEILQRLESSLDPIPFDTQVARVFGRLYGEVKSDGRKVRGSKSLDLMIAATALHHRMPLYTRNPSDFAPVQHLIEVHSI
jgi:predicted nucleic acid-binding protein